MTWYKPLVSATYWRHVFSVRRAITSLLAAFGTLWLVIEVSSFFSTALAAWFKSLWLPFFGLGLAWAAWENWPRYRVAHRLVGRDVGIEVRVGDLFSSPGAIVVGTNRSFDTDLGSGLISSRSVQGRFTRKYYDDVAHLDREIAEQLAPEPFEDASATKRGKKRMYAIGTCIKLSARDRDAYWIAIATMNEHGAASASIEDLRASLPRLWEYIATRGDCGPVAVPVLGSGYSRLPQTREEIVREIVQSFVAACASQRFCETLTIVIPVQDFYANEIDIAELGAYVRHVCRYSDLKSPAATGTGTPVS